MAAGGGQQAAQVPIRIMRANQLLGDRRAARRLPPRRLSASVIHLQWRRRRAAGLEIKAPKSSRPAPA